MITVGDAEVEQQEIRAALDAGVPEPRVMGWQYSAAAIVLGRGQKPSPLLLQRACDERLAVVTRVTGGGAVLAGPWMLSLTLLVPAAHALARRSLPAGYSAVGEACRRVLGRFHVPTEITAEISASESARSREADELSWACFAGLSYGELVAAGGRKIVGVSQVRRRDAVGVCIGILLGRPDWAALLRVWQGRDDPSLVRQFEGRTASCDQFVPLSKVPSIHSLAVAFEAELPTLGLAA